MDTIRNLAINFAVFMWLVSYAPQGALWASGEFSKTAPAELLAATPAIIMTLSGRRFRQVHSLPSKPIQNIAVSTLNKNCHRIVIECSRSRVHPEGW